MKKRLIEKAIVDLQIAIHHLEQAIDSPEPEELPPDLTLNINKLYEDYSTVDIWVLPPGEAIPEGAEHACFTRVFFHSDLSIALRPNKGAFDG